MNLWEKIKFGKLLNKINIHNIDVLSGIEFEDFICNLFTYFGYKSQKTALSGDNGIDILVKIGNNSIGIQTKLYYNHSVGNKAIQEVFSGKSFYKLTYAIACTNSTFSVPAINLATELKVGVIDRNVLVRILSNSKKENKKLIKSLLIK